MNTTSFLGMFSDHGIVRVEIPIIQRDYAQGREDVVVSRIRRGFLDVLDQALTGGKPVSLDFVYGEICNGVLTPLDGQQRLTTLFLLHWYLAVRAGVESAGLQGRLTYETRYSSREFCHRLADQRPSFPLLCLSEWIRDQPWFLGSWRHDPSVLSMLVVLDEIHTRFADAERAKAAWGRLTDSVNPAITFHMMPIAEMGLTDDLYIKMNSRGKALTPFEQFKASFEKTLRGISAEHYQHFVDQVDNAWADLLWPLRGNNDIIDDEFMRYFRFVTDVIVLRAGLDLDTLEVLAHDVDRGATLVYGADNPSWDAHQRFLLAALDTWVPEDVPAFFERVFSNQGWRPGAVAIYDEVQLFAACCQTYGLMSGRNRVFSLPRMLLLYAVLVHRIEKTTDFAARIRTIRNLVFASENEIRLEAFPSLLPETATIVTSGDLTQVSSFNTAQLDEEQRKATFVAANPILEEPLQRLEDHDLIHGCLAAFDLTAATFARRATTFLDLFPETDPAPLQLVSGALLACGDYSQRRSRHRFQLGAPRAKDVWRQLFTNTANEDFPHTRKALLDLLDQLAADPDSKMELRLQRTIDTYLGAQEAAGRLDWRYYLVKYPEMRAGDTGLYAGPEQGTKGYDLCMLRRRQMNSWYRDPYLSAIVGQSGARLGEDVEDPWFTGHQSEPRWLVLSTSRAGLRCRPEGFLLRAPEIDAYRSAFKDVLTHRKIDSSLLLRVPQTPSDGEPVDTEDRVQLGAELLKELVAMRTA